MLQSVLLACEYFPNTKWWSAYWQHHEVWIEKEEYFVKSSFRNRCHIAGPQGLLNLSVPIEGGRNQKTLFKDIRISYSEAWQKVHLRSIQNTYRRTPYFEYFESDLQLFFEQKPAFLFDWNRASIEWILKQLRYTPKHSFTSRYSDHVPATDLRIQKTSICDSSIVSEYPQAFVESQAFIPHLSLLDTLFCTGKYVMDFLPKNF
ncbi:MAG: WbqC family protein [Chitinophagaceae bacterium]